MKIYVKTLKGARFEIQVNLEDSVADVKKNIETVMGVTAEQQMLIHKGKVLKDETTVEANNVSEKSVIAVMKRKPASTGTPTASANLKPQVHAAHPSSTATPTEPAWDAASNGNYENISESNIQQILEIGNRAWSREAVAFALCLAYNDRDKALEYIYFGIPVQSEDPYTTKDQTQEWSLDILRNTPEFEYLRPLMQSDPSLLQDFLQMLKKENPPLFRFVQENKSDFLGLLLEQPQEPNNRGDSGNQVGESEETEVDEQPQADQTNKPNKGGGDGGNQVGESEETEVDEQPQADQTNKPSNGGGDGGNQVGESEETEVVTPEDYELIGRLEALGFERGDAAVMYFACNRNLQVAANHLLGYKHE